LVKIDKTNIINNPNKKASNKRGFFTVSKSDYELIGTLLAINFTIGEEVSEL